MKQRTTKPGWSALENRTLGGFTRPDPARLGPRSRVKSSETVGELKDAILKEKPDQLRDVDAYELVLYKVSLPDDKTLEQSAAQALDEELVVASKKLSELFPIKPPAGTVSIVVKIPRTSE